MSESVKLRHVVSLAGVVREQSSDPSDATARAGLEVNRLAGAQVEILVDEAPQAFQTKMKAVQSDPAWATRGKRIDRATSQSDGVFFFLDLPPGEAGETYRLRVSMPHRGSRYGIVETDPIAVQPNLVGEQVQVAQVDVELPVTQIVGSVTDQNGQVVPRARVRLRGDARSVESGEDGSYRLRHLLAGKPTLEASSAGFETALQRVELVAGQTLELDIVLQPAQN